jgi:hypothetical protein
MCVKRRTVSRDKKMCVKRQTVLRDKKMCVKRRTVSRDKKNVCQTLDCVARQKSVNRSLEFDRKVTWSATQTEQLCAATVHRETGIEVT